MHDEAAEALLCFVLDHYGFAEPGWGERPGLCPVHDEFHPSASINRGKGLFHCHACGAGGNGTNIVMARENLNYHEAVKLIESWGYSMATATSTKPTRSRKKGSRRWVPPSLRSAV